MKPGLYRHFKGALYRAKRIVLHSETQEEMVLYKALYDKKWTWVRPASMWEEVIFNEKLNYHGQRFNRLPWWQQLLLFWKR